MGARVNAVINLNLPTARSLDKGGEQTAPRSLLHGVPVVLQDNINVEGLLVGSRRRQSPTLYGAAVTRKLRAAGAVVVAKVNANDEFGWASMSESTLGWPNTQPPQPRLHTGRVEFRQRDRRSKELRSSSEHRH